MAVRQSGGRHLRPVQLLRLRPVHRGVRLERRLGQPAGRARGGDRVRPADDARTVPARALGAGTDASGSRSPTAGRRIRSRCSTLSSNSNDALVALMLVVTLLVIRRRRVARHHRVPRGVDEVRAARARTAVPARSRSGAVGQGDGAGTSSPTGSRSLVMFVPVIAGHDLGPFWRDTILYQANRPAPFSIWGLYGTGSEHPAASRSGRRRGARADRPVLPSQARDRRGRSAGGGGDHRAADGRHLLVLPVHRVVLPDGSDRRCSHGSESRSGRPLCPRRPRLRWRRRSLSPV